MSDDMTFCCNNHCRDTSCERNPVNIRYPYREHSSAFFTECEHWDMPEVVFEPSEEEQEAQDG